MSTTDLTLLFADICNSTQLYERLGDHDAKERISDCLKSIELISEHHGGIVVKTIGDELLIRFDTVDNAVTAASEMQANSKRSAQVNLQDRMDLRVALHHGSAILEKDDVFGDSVNVAARLVTLSKPGQILTSRETMKLLSPFLQARCRHIDRTPVKGKSEDIDIYEILDEEDDVTQMTVGVTSKPKKPSTLLMTYKQQDFVLESDQAIFTVGRSDYCNLVVDEDLASRQHLTLENRRGKIFIADLSTNGTWIKNERGREMFLRREEILLPPSGEISFGKSFREFPEHVLHFRVTYE